MVADNRTILLARPAIALKLRSLTIAMLIASVVLGNIGCNRALYRKKADREAYQLIDEKVCHSGEDPGHALRIEIDSQSRMFDPFDPDRPPMPKDDPKSNTYMNCVDGKRGYPLWHANGDTNTAENPDWWRFLPLDERGVLVLDSDTAFQLARLNSPGYQQELETLYLSALDVSSERFRFDTQFFGGLQSFYTADGPLRSGSGGESSSNLAVGPYSVGQRPWSMQRSFTTGADLVVGMANSIVWEFSGPDTQSASTILDFTLVQPLLRNAGRDRIMERLTLSERRLLANVRAFERYRRSFYLSITTGRSVDAGPSRSGGVFGVGLEGFSGLGGGFAGLGGGGNLGIGGGGGVAQAGGFLGLLQDQLQIQNQEENVARLRENLLLLNDTLVEMLTTIPTDQEAIPRQRLQVAQAQQALLSAQSQLVNQQAAFNASVDSFLGDLGLPPYLCVEIRDPVLNQFQLISPDLKDRRNQVSDIRTVVGNINTRLLETGREAINPATNLPELKITWTPQVAQLLEDLNGQLVPLVELQKTFIETDLPGLKRDIEALAEAVPDRQRSSSQLLNIYQTEKDQICTLLPLTMVDKALFDPTDFNRIGQGLIDDYTKLEKRMTAYAIEIEAIDQGLQELLQSRASQTAAQADADGSLSQQIRDKGILAAQDLIAAIAEDVLVMQLIQARARIESVSLPEVDISAPQALEIARQQRRDWANARASLVDSWRLIEFNADNLESSLDITFSGDLQNTDSNPFKLRSDAGRLRAGLQWDAPLTRLQERNTYRQSLIEYQQARRNYYQYEDGVWQLLRGQIRQLRANQVNFELQRSAVRMAAEQISLNEDLRLLREARGLSSGPTAARDIIFALSDLLNAQNGFLNIWVNYEVVRRNLDLDMGTMELTPDGYWIDPGVIRANTVGGSAAIAGDTQGMIIEASDIILP
ncbi:hypothetical protein EC9_11960 [Rosistilla ulvae]|uniref:Outer membrane efflux protein n=1 Tax=Rosistilla ulvae TaxID=1930277 RepID=A0A517LWL4_9BACT|nr:TolC family protein [Rosistilla ulvae]QDS87020.1 hypothetical protein EC9_11960 [Rosistilla ulvae]